MSTPLYQLKAEFFRTLGHPLRIRVLEMVSERDCTVAELLAEVHAEPSQLSGHMRVLRQAGLIKGRREGTVVVYALAEPQVPQLLAVARAILTGVLTGQAALLADLREADGAGQEEPA